MLKGVAGYMDPKKPLPTELFDFDMERHCKSCYLSFPLTYWRHNSELVIKSQNNKNGAHCRRLDMLYDKNLEYTWEGNVQNIYCYIRVPIW